MRILVTSDLHYSLKQFDWLTKHASGVDLVVIAGDLLEVNASVDRRAQVVVLSKYLQQLSRVAEVAVCSGNHDLDGVGPDGENHAAWLAGSGRRGVLVDGASRWVRDITMTVCPWWDGPASRAAIGEQLAEMAPRVKGDWIWAYHAPPAGSSTAWDGRRSFGDEALTGWIKQYSPKIVLCGHVHQAPFVPDGSWVDRVGDTWVFNPGQQPGAEPAHIALDLDAGLAHWVSIEGTETLTLNDPEARPHPMTEWPAMLRA